MRIITCWVNAHVHTHTRLQLQAVHVQIILLVFFSLHWGWGYYNMWYFGDLFGTAKSNFALCILSR